MRGYGQFCPVAKACEIFGERWTPLILRELIFGSIRFNDLRRGVPLLSPTVLSDRLKALEKAGVVERRRSIIGKGMEYHLTVAGQEFKPIILALGEWGQRWARTDFSSGELNAGLLMWYVHRNVNAAAFPPGRAVVQFEFNDLPPGEQLFWIVNNSEKVDICITDPGFRIDLCVVTHLCTLTRAWMGDLPLRKAIASGAIEVHGRRDLRQHFERWFNLSPFAKTWKPPPSQPRQLNSYSGSTATA
jgi:DNA-binding HxlR family transcriptional regulator